MGAHHKIRPIFSGMFENFHNKMLKRKKKEKKGRKKSGPQKAPAKYKYFIWKMKRLAKLTNQVIRGRRRAHL